MTSTAALALHYGLRLDASPEFVQGYADGMRLDQRGQGVACGRGWIPRSKKCSRDKAAATPKEAKARTVEKSKERAKLKSEVKAAKGQKPRVKEKIKPKKIPDIELAGTIADELKRNGFRANPWQKGKSAPRIYVQGSGGASGYLEIDQGKVYGNLTGYGRSGEAFDIAKKIAGQYEN